MGCRKVVKIAADGNSEIVNSAIVKEHEINLYINNVLRFQLVCTPENIYELAIGRLLTEGYISCYDKNVSAYTFEGEHDIYFEMEVEPMVKRYDYKRLPDIKYDKEWIFALINAFAKDGKIHKKTKAAHSCILARREEILFSCEDIGRHNAMDKAIGYMHINHINPLECILFTSGRVPAEIAHKAIMAGIPLLVSKAVPTDKAIELAIKYNLGLICKAWPDSFEIFN